MYAADDEKHASAEVKRVQSAGTSLDEIRRTPEKESQRKFWSQPQNAWAVVPSMIKAASSSAPLWQGRGYAAALGAGIVGSAPLQHDCGGASWGLQFGRQAGISWMLVMNDKGSRI